MKDFYSSMNQNSEYINQDSSLKQDEYSAAKPDAGAAEVKQLNPCGPDQRQSWKLYAGAIVKSEAQPAGMQLKRAAKLLIVIGLNIKHAVCRITFMLYPIFFYNEWLFS